MKYTLILYSRLALADYLNRTLHHHVQAGPRGHSGTGFHESKGGQFSIQAPTCFVLERSSMHVDSSGLITSRFSISLPARGRSILGHECSSLVCEHLPDLIHNSLLSSAHQLNLVQRHIECIEDQQYMRDFISKSDGKEGY